MSFLTLPGQREVANALQQQSGHWTTQGGQSTKQDGISKESSSSRKTDSCTSSKAKEVKAKVEIALTAVKSDIIREIVRNREKPKVKARVKVTTEHATTVAKAAT